MANTGQVDLSGKKYYRHTLPIRIMHWINVVLMSILLMSGLGIFNVHPALYWGKSSYSGHPPVFAVWSEENDAGRISGFTDVLGHKFVTTGFLGASRNRWGMLSDRGFPAWLTLPDEQWLSMARRWHFFIAWLFVINGLTFVVYSFLSGHLRRDIIPNKTDLKQMGRSIIDHLVFRRPRGEASMHYNVLQKISYLGLILFLLPLMILMGLGMSPALNALFPGWVDIFSGRQSIRTLHFIIAWALALFVVIHVLEVIVSGLLNSIRSMITGYYRVEEEVMHEE